VAVILGSVPRGWLEIGRLIIIYYTMTHWCNMFIQMLHYNELFYNKNLLITEHNTNRKETKKLLIKYLLMVNNTKIAEIFWKLFHVEYFHYIWIFGENVEPPKIECSFLGNSMELLSCSFSQLFYCFCRLF